MRFTVGISPQAGQDLEDLVKDLTRVAIERKLNRTAPWSQQDIVAEAVRE
jgi:hypothetical protein